MSLGTFPDYAEMYGPAFVERARRLSDRNLADYLAHCARSAPGGGRVIDEAGVVLFAGTHAYPGAFNNGVIKRSAQANATEVLDRAESFFAEVGHPFVVWVRDHADLDLDQECLRRDYRVREPATGLSGVATDQRPDPALLDVPAGFELREVNDARGYADYLEVVGDVWQLGGAPLPVLESVLFSLASLETDQMRVMVVYQGNHPVSSCSVFVTDEVGGMQWAGTRKQASGNRLGQIATAHAWQAAFDSGASMVVGQASGRGTPVWNSIGYRTVTRYRRYLSPLAARR